MTDESGLNYLQPSRRRVLQTVRGLAAIGASGVVTSAPAAGDPGDQLWTFETDGAVESSPTVVDGTVYIGSDDTNLYAVDAETGSQQWAFETGGEIFSSPTTVGGTVFFGSRDENLYAVDDETGSQQWHSPIRAEVWSSPTVVDETVFVGSHNNNLELHSKDGYSSRTFETGGEVFSSPTVADGTVFIGSSDRSLYAVDPNMSDRLPTQQWAFETGGQVDSSPTVAEGTVFVGSNDGNLYAVNAETGDQQWAFETGGRIESSPTVAGGTVFVGSNDGILYAVDSETGSRRWIFETTGRIISSPTVVDGKVFIGSNDNTLYAVDAGIAGSSEGTRAKLGTLGHHDDWKYAKLIPSFGLPIQIAIAAGIGTSGVGMYAWRRSRQSDGADPSGADTTDSDIEPQSTSESSSSGTTGGVSELKAHAHESIDRAERAIEDADFEMAVDEYEEAISLLSEAIAEATDSATEAELTTKREETQTALETATARREQRESIVTTLQAAERSFKEGIARYAAGNQTVGRIRFRQAREAFEEAQQAIADSDTEVLIRPIEVSFEQEATLRSMTLEELAVLDESTVETLAAVDIESVTDLEADPENEEITPAVVSDLQQSAEIDGEEAVLLTILSWWYEGASRKFGSETELSQRYEQADHGFNQCT